MKNIFLVALLFVCSRQLQAQETNTSAAVKWVNEHMVAIDTVKAENGLNDLLKLNESIGDATIVGLGECTHGSSEIFSMKHRLLEYLAKEKGFTIFAMEAAMPETFLINEYVLEGKGDPQQLLGNVYAWTWYTREVLDMIIWMKKYNDTAAHKIMFGGFDVNIPNGAIRALRSYAADMVPAAIPAINEYDSLYRHFIKKELSKKKRAAALDDLAANIYKQVAPSIAQPDTSWVIQHINLLKQYNSTLVDDDSRDKSMAENVGWIKHKYPGQKMVVWAHNDHIRKEADKYGTIRMGHYLQQKYGSGYIAMAFSTAEGTYNAVMPDWRTPAIGRTLTAPDKKSVEDIFKDARAVNFIIDLRKATNGDAGTDWIFSQMKIRNIGAVVNEKYQFFGIQPIKDYDILIFLKTTHAVNSLL